ncbi:hypothetical protein DESC_600121 [Desulfosarcina cetonica]|nr:hypothetical protein DESC_600121 [Desulfosarcina cetonica]
MRGNRRYRKNSAPPPSIGSLAQPQGQARHGRADMADEMLQAVVLDDQPEELAKHGDGVNILLVQDDGDAMITANQPHDRAAAFDRKGEHGGDPFAARRIAVLHPGIVMHVIDENRPALDEGLVLFIDEQGALVQIRRADPVAGHPKQLTLVFVVEQDAGPFDLEGHAHAFDKMVQEHIQVFILGHGQADGFEMPEVESVLRRWGHGYLLVAWAVKAGCFIDLLFHRSWF